MEFEDLYSARAAFVYGLCYRLEPEVERAERLFSDVWRQLYRESPKGEDQEVTLCRAVACSHRRLGRHGAAEGGAGSPQTALGRLAPEYRLPLVLREVGGLGYPAIASALDIPQPTVRARLARARALLRAARGGGSP
jgi:hypothetical protein